MSSYDINSRYYNSDNEFDLPQANLTVDYYNYDTTVVLANEEGRLDLVSYRVYNTPAKWWIIARFNSIINPETVMAGSKLMIPQL